MKSVCSSYLLFLCAIEKGEIIYNRILSPTLSVDDLMLGAEMDLQLVENSVLALENILKAWLHDQTGEREHLQLLLPATVQTNTPTKNPTPACKPDLGDSCHTYTLVDWFYTIA